MIDMDDAGSWLDLDPWWESFVDSHTAVELKRPAKCLDNRFFRGATVSLDPWSRSHRDAYALSQLETDTATITQGWDGDRWPTVDSWWQSYNDARTETARALHEELQRSDDCWRRSNSRFDVDPLSTNWQSNQPTRGPLRPNQEENWSQWLAHLLRGADGLLLGELFGETYCESPQTVEREVYLSEENESESNRYADILVFFGTRGLSIEVKKGDEHYEKTTHTAGLVETEFPQEWEHTLLLPKYKQPELRRSFDESMREQEAGRHEIRSTESDDITVVFWEDVSRSIRSILMTEESLPPHWEASAYLFCTVIEQKLLNYNATPDVSKLATAKEVVEATQSLRVAAGGPEEQLFYLQNLNP